MPLFSSDRERRLWFWTVAVVVAIFSTLGLAARLAGVASQPRVRPARHVQRRGGRDGGERERGAGLGKTVGTDSNQ